MKPTLPPLKRRAALAAMLLSFVVFGQDKTLDHADFERWNTIENEAISPDGRFVIYSLEQGESNQFLKIRGSDGSAVFEYDRAEKGVFTFDSRYALFTIKAWKDSVLELKRRKVKQADLPKDSLGIYRIPEGTLQKIARVKNYKLPEKWSGYLAYQVDPLPEKKAEGADSTQNKQTKEKPRKPGKENGYDLVVQELANGRQDTFRFVTEYKFAKEGKRLAYATTGETADSGAGVFVLDLETSRRYRVHSAPKARYYQLNFSDSGTHLGFVADEDTTRVQVRPTRLYYWKDGMPEARSLAGPEPMAKDLRPSRYAELHFSEDESRMFFGLAEPPVVRDTTLLEEEIVNVEVWTYDEPRLYTVQEMDIKEDTVKAYTAVAHLPSLQLRQLASAAYPDLETGAKGNARFALASTSEPYQLERQWLGMTARDYALVDVADGTTREILSGIYGWNAMSLSPDGGFVFGYDRADSTWLTYSIAEPGLKKLTKGQVFYDEIHDSPSLPPPYGAAGWTKEDGSLILYDRYDLWEFNPLTGASERLTRGRETHTVYRYVPLDEEQEYLDPRQPWMLTTFNETDKSSGFATLDPRRSAVRQLVSGPYYYNERNVARALDADKILFTRESFEEFPDLYVSGPDFQDPVRISRANPQQDQYQWGNIELVHWNSLDGTELTGMLVKPAGFDPAKKYPMIVNFYEKSSDGLHRHRAPAPGRSTINYSFYASRGYLIFNPDVAYRIGYPGESAYNCVIPGVTALIEKGFVDKENIGLQGHSWGGYQIAYLVTRTDLFKAAEAGAPVPNMFSAYGGIRWQTGLSRQFQYEHTQSRIGGTPWEYPIRYIENSPIFNIDKINTPLLIMHNDADGHVPWYQGIEFFMALRRLGKPAWFLNYNGEPHWPLKLQNRKDFNIRLAQFFDHYLKGAPEPEWMYRGVPALEKGINQGYELRD